MMSNAYETAREKRISELEDSVTHYDRMKHEFGGIDRIPRDYSLKTAKDAAELSVLYLSSTLDLSKKK